MIDIVYLAEAGDERGALALSILKEAGCQTHEMSAALMTVQPFWECATFGLFSSDGRFPSAHIRIMQFADAGNRKIAVPRWAWGCGTRIALRRYAPDAWPSEERFAIALRDLHQKAIALTNPEAQSVPAKRIKPREEWKSGFHARVRRGEFLEYRASGGWGDLC